MTVGLQGKEVSELGLLKGKCSVCHCVTTFNLLDWIVMLWKSFGICSY